MERQSTKDIIESLERSVIWRFGPPSEIQTDAGRQFTSYDFEKFVETLGIKHSKGAPFHKESNGQVERFHRTIETALSNYVNKWQGDWDAYLPAITFTINCLPNETTGIAPFVAMHGREPRMFPDNHLQRKYGGLPNIEAHTTATRMQIEEIQRFLNTQLGRQSEKQSEKWLQGKRVHPRQVKPGDTILVKRAPPANKLMPLLQGPYIVESTDDTNMHFRDNRNILRVAHKNDIRVMPNNRDSNRDYNRDSNRDNKEDNNQPTMQEEQPNKQNWRINPRRSRRLAEKLS